MKKHWFFVILASSWIAATVSVAFGDMVVSNARAGQRTGGTSRHIVWDAVRDRPQGHWPQALAKVCPAETGRTSPIMLPGHAPGEASLFRGKLEVTSAQCWDAAGNLRPILAGKDNPVYSVSSDISKTLATTLNITAPLDRTVFLIPNGTMAASFFTSALANGDAAGAGKVVFGIDATAGMGCWVLDIDKFVDGVAGIEDGTATKYPIANISLMPFLSPPGTVTVPVQTSHTLMAWGFANAVINAYQAIVTATGNVGDHKAFDIREVPAGYDTDGNGFMDPEHSPGPGEIWMSSLIDRSCVVVNLSPPAKDAAATTLTVSPAPGVIITVPTIDSLIANGLVACDAMGAFMAVEVVDDLGSLLTQVSPPARGAYPASWGAAVAALAPHGLIPGAQFVAMTILYVDSTGNTIFLKSIAPLNVEVLFTGLDLDGVTTASLRAYPVDFSLICGNVHNLGYTNSPLDTSSVWGNPVPAAKVGYVLVANVQSFSVLAPFAISAGEGEGEGESEWAVMPQSQPVPSSAGSFTVTLSSRSVQPILWAATCASAPWLSLATVDQAGLLSSGGSRRITIRCESNSAASERVGNILFSACSVTPPLTNVLVTQAGSAGPAPDHFRFSDIDTQTVGQPFAVTITACDAAGSTVTSFNSRVSLYAAHNDPLTPTKATLLNGVWTGNVTLTQTRASTTITAQFGAATGTSAQFSVGGGSSATGEIGGTVTVPQRLYPQVPEGSTITVYAKGEDGSEISKDVATSNFKASFLFTGLTQQTYTVHAVARLGLFLSPMFTSQSKVVDLSAQYCMPVRLSLMTKEKPVLFVPGTFGSTMKGLPLPIPCISGLLPASQDELECIDRIDIRLIDFGRFGSYTSHVNVGWRDLKTTLGDSFEVVEVPWDWRVSALDKNSPGPAWARYLKPVIDEVKRNTGHDKVDVVAHSLGGLMVRAYIQSDDYEQANGHDIDRFAMVAVPNEGVAVTYQAWEGGDPWGADEAAFQTLTAFPFYTTVTGYGIYLQGTLASRISVTNDIGDVLNAIVNPGLATQELVQDFLHNNAITIRDMLPTYRFLGRIFDSPGYLYAHTGFSILNPLRLENGLLNDLNNADALASRFSTIGIDPDMVYAKAFTAKGTPTVNTIKVGRATSEAIYPLGAPDFLLESLGCVDSNGDGTVHDYQDAFANLPSDCIEITPPEQTPIAHSELVGYFAQEIAQFLLEGEGKTLQTAGLPKAPSAPTLRFAASGPGTSIHVTEPDDLGSGIRCDTGELEDAIPGAEFSSSSMATSIRLGGPADGNYTFCFNGTPGYEVMTGVAFENNSTGGSVQFRWIARTVRTEFSVVLTASNSEPLVAGLPVMPPTQIQSTQVSGVTKVSWQAAQGPNVAEYHVYGRPDDDARYVLLGITTGLDFLTDKPWRNTLEDPVWHLVILSALADGTESCFASTVENGADIVANLAADVTSGGAPLTVHFTDQSLGGVTSWAWDFDSNGTVDSTDQNPAFTYSIPGTYAVTLTVQGPSGSDSRTIGSYVTVLPSATSDVTPPQIAITFPTADGDYRAASDSIDLGGTAFDDREVASIDWYCDFGPSGSIVGANAWTIPAIPLQVGVNTITVVARDGFNNLASAQLTVNNFGPQPLRANFAASTLMGKPPLTVEFFDWSPVDEDQIVDWWWQFGDGGTSHQPNPTHVYSNEGVYTVSLTLTTFDGTAIETKDNLITVSESVPIATSTIVVLFALMLLSCPLALRKKKG